MTELQKKFIELDKKKKEYKEFIEEYSNTVNALVEELGVGVFFQDEEGTVYETVVPEGRFVHYEKFSVDRTRREGEAKGSLSMKRAREAGFIVEGK